MPTEPVGPGDSQAGAFRWGHSRLSLWFQVGADGVARLVALGLAAEPDQSHAVTRLEEVGPPLVEVQLVGSGRNWSGERSVEAVAGARLRYEGRFAAYDGRQATLGVVSGRRRQGKTSCSTR